MIDLKNQVNELSRAVNRFYCIGVLQLMLGAQRGTSGKMFVLGSRRGVAVGFITAHLCCAGLLFLKRYPIGYLSAPVYLIFLLLILGLDTI